jgi:hypothetical protein
MNNAELRWRVRTGLRNAVSRAAAAARKPKWQRSSIRHVIRNLPRAASLRATGDAEGWQSAHAALAGELLGRSSFVLVPAERAALACRIAREFPGARADAVARADRIIAGEFDLLGYSSLRFDTRHRHELLDWHLDPVLGRRAPMRFWSTMPFLDPLECGDHKVIWELNRHQHLLVLGRAFWLTGDGRYRRSAISHLLGWIAGNPPLLGINWASMLELGFRTLSWVWALHFFADGAEDDAEPWIVDLLVALDRQLGQIERNLSFYFSPNTHLLGEALALYVTGRSLPWLRSGERYAAAGRRVLVAEISRQIGADGGHVERSMHYHRYTLDFYSLALAVARLTDDPAADTFAEAVRRLGTAARLLADDTGRVPHIGDDDGGMLLPICGRAVDDIRDSLSIAGALTHRAELCAGSTPEEAYWMLGHPRLLPALEHGRRAPHATTVGSAALPDTGYYVSRSSAGDHLVVDAGPHGFANGGHAHADALSLTLSVDGVPLLIDPGTGLYTADPVVRDRFRSTTLHNTLTIDGRSQSEGAGPFHWRRAARATAHLWRTSAGFDYLEASHDGYAPLEHRRHVLSVHGDLLIVADYVDGGGEHDLAVLWHLHPRWRVRVDGRRATLRSDGRQAGFVVSSGTLTKLVASRDGIGWQSPAYGRIEPTTALRVTKEGPLPAWIVSVFGLDADNQVQILDPIPVRAKAGDLDRGVAIRITRAASTDFFGVAVPAAARAGAGSAPSWRVAAYETDARVLLCRSGAPNARVALVDGSFVRTSDRHPARPRVQATVAS